MLKAATFAVALLAAGPALACGNPMLWAILFARVPQAELVFDADLAAREAGALQARVIDPSEIVGRDYHSWSMGWLRQAAETLSPSVTAGLAEGDSVTILLADEVAAVRFEWGGAPTVVPAAGLNFAEGFDAITTINALESGLYHGITAAQMIDTGVLVPTDPDRKDVIAGLF